MLYALRNGMDAGKDYLSELQLSPETKVTQDPREFTKKLLEVYFSSSSSKASALYQEMRTSLSGIIVSVRKRMKALYESELKRLQEVLAGMSAKDPVMDYKLSDKEKLQQIMEKDRTPGVSSKTVKRQQEQLKKKIKGEKVTLDPELSDLLEQHAKEGESDLRGTTRLASYQEDDIMLLIKTANSKLLAN